MKSLLHYLSYSAFEGTRWITTRAPPAEATVAARASGIRQKPAAYFKANPPAPQLAAVGVFLDVWHDWQSADPAGALTNEGF